MTPQIKKEILQGINVDTIMEIIALKPDIKSFEECLNPSHFHYIKTASRKISDYQEKTVQHVIVPSIAYRLTQPLNYIGKKGKSKIKLIGNLDQTNI